MKIALVNPRSIVSDVINMRNDIIDALKGKIELFADMSDYRESFPSLALLTVAGLFENENEFVFIDEELITQERSEEILKNSGFDLVLLTMLNSQAERGVKIARLMNEIDIPVICGGYYPSIMKEEIKEYFTSVLTGEAEDTLPRFLEDFKNDNVKKIYQSQGNNDPCKFPHPRYDLIENKDEYKIIPVQATRGCIYNCSFCTIMNIFGRKFRKKEVSVVVDEIREIKRLFGRKIISFVDENLFLDRVYAKKLAEALMPLKIQWECYSDISIGNDTELLKLLYKSGCRQIQLGLESLDEEILMNVSRFKGENLKHYRSYIENIQSNGIEAIGMFIAGFDGDTLETFRKLDQFLEETNMFNFIVEWLTPVPGTEIYEKLKAEGRIKKGLWEKEETISFIPDSISEIELEYGTIWLSYRFTRPERIRKRNAYFKKIMKNLLESKQK